MCIKQHVKTDIDKGEVSLDCMIKEFFLLGIVELEDKLEEVIGIEY